MKSSYKLIVLLVATIVLAYVLTSPGISNAVLSFCFAGVVPGMNHVMSPGAVMVTIAVLFGVVAVVLLAFWIVRMLRVRRLMRQFGPQPIESGDVAEPAALATKVSTEAVIYSRPEPAPTVATPKLARPGKRTVPAGRMSHLSGAILAGIRLAINRVNRLVHTALHRVRWLISALYHDTLMLAGLAFAAARTSLVVLSVMISIAARKAWLHTKAFLKWLHPYALRLDSWLELQYRAGLSVVSRWIARSERAQAMKLMLVHTTRSIRELLK